MSVGTRVRHRAWQGGIMAAALLALVMTLLLAPSEARAEYGDVVMNNYSDEADMRPVVFPHWFHRIRFRCKVCHGDLGFEFEAGGNEINMLKIIDGEYCGACHNGNIAWGVENCELCHTGKPGTETQVHGSTLKRLVTPASQSQ
ncbi:c(7)-type cytochrome triheme domain-containing protein [Halomonas sp. DQ26W]|uniref:c(7)-type cytochrome triheme domain-containing protein n=1 Tax=Halomonas sp. DQ26W TaxID=2282311 RepID=UPI001C6A7D79|nr:c(7)-type cytochrome triheme domain-containing protein [Halomonas sp. DQ26W]